MSETEFPLIHWTEEDETCSARWRSESGMPPPKRVVVADDRIPADVAYRLACEGTALLWRGDFQNARHLLQALARRLEPKPVKEGKPGKSGRSPKAAVATVPTTLLERFHLYRQAQSQRARTLGMLLLPFEADHSIPLRRAPDVSQACLEVYGPGDVPYVASLRELLGLIGAHEWRKAGVEISALGENIRIHPHYGVFSPVRGEYVDLVAKGPFPAAVEGNSLAFEIGAGTGVLAAVLAQRGIARVVATELAPRALACARENIVRLGLSKRVEVVETDMFPEGRAALVVCNPPWLPGRPASPLEQAIYDPESRMLRGFLAGLAAHLAPGGEGWLILSDLAEHLGLRTRGELLAMFAAAGLKVAGRREARPRHPRAADASDPLHAARAAEVTSLWRLVADQE